MCGICGVYNLDGAPVDTDVLAAMNRTITHRGPDGDGVHISSSIALAMRRLSIIDVAGSDQPLYNEDGSIALVFNGEIYNYPELRSDLQFRGHTLRTNGDGETVSHLYEEYGVDALNHLRGMFAFALWDSNAHRLFIARDRTGQKPLYYYHDDDVFIFASEIKALLQHPAVPREPAFDDPKILALYLSYGYVPAPDTAFKHIRALMPGHYLTVGEGGSPAVCSYWEPPYPTDSFTVTGARAAEYAAMVRETLDDAVRMRLLSDVPLGAFLSGGLDSSLIVALMQQHSSETVKTFSIGFAGDDSFDETPYAQEVADYLHTEHTAFTVKPDALELLPKLVWFHDQPFSDSSAIPTFLVSELTRQHVTVALTGDGGDELFAGYERFYAASLVRKLGIVPRPVWRLLAGALGRFPEGTGYYNLFKRAGRFARGASQPLELAYFDWVRLFSADMVHELTGQSDVAGRYFAGLFANGATLPGILDANMRTYLPDDLLIKADRCSMAASLEARAPFLDHRLIELAATIPFNLKLNGSITKYILKRAARGLLPEHIIHRKKHGFGVPLGAWLRADIAPVREILLSREVRERGLLNMGAVEGIINDHANGRRDNGHRLWTLLTLEWWYRLFIDAKIPVKP